MKQFYPIEYLLASQYETLEEFSGTPYSAGSALDLARRAADEHGGHVVNTYWPADCFALMYLRLWADHGVEWKDLD